jgi:hypothetical protein
MALGNRYTRVWNSLGNARWVTVLSLIDKGTCDVESSLYAELVCRLWDLYLV